MEEGGRIEEFYIQGKRKLLYSKQLFLNIDGGGWLNRRMLNRGEEEAVLVNAVVSEYRWRRMAE